MPATLELTEGQDGKFFLAEEANQGEFIPLNGLYLPDGQGGYEQVHAKGHALQAAIEQWNAGAIGISSLPTPVQTVAHGHDGNDNAVPLATDADGKVKLAQSLSLGSKLKLEADDGQGTVGEIYRDGNALRTSDPAVGSQSDAPEADTSTDASLLSWVQGLIDTIKGGLEISSWSAGSLSIGSLPDVTIGGWSAGDIGISSFPSALVNNSDEVKTTASVNVGSVELEADDSQGNGVVPLWREDGTNYLGVVDKSQIDEGNNSIRSFSAKSQTAAFDSLNATTQQVKASAGEIADLHFTNPNTSLVYLKVWYSTGNTAGTDDADAVYGIPAESGFSPHFDSIEAASGIEVAATANPALGDGTSLSTPIAGTVHYR